MLEWVVGLAAIWGAVLSSYIFLHDRQRRLRGDRRRIVVLCRKLRGDIGRIFNGPEPDTSTAWRLAWTPEELRELDTLCASLNEEAHHRATVATDAMQWMADTMPRQGNIGGSFPFEEWRKRSERAQDALIGLEGCIRLDIW